MCSFLTGALVLAAVAFLLLKVLFDESKDDDGGEAQR